MAHATPDHRRRGRRTHTGVQHPMAGHHLDEWRTEYDDAYIEGWNDGYEAAINDMLNDGIDTTTGIRRR